MKENDQAEEKPVANNTTNHSSSASEQQSANQADSPFVTDVTMVNAPGAQPQQQDNSAYVTDVTMVNAPGAQPQQQDNSAYVTDVTMVNAPGAQPQDSDAHSTGVTMAHAAPDGTMPLTEQQRTTGHKKYLFDIGETLGKYKIEATLGKGGMGEVYLARHTALEVSRAIKVLPQEIAARDKQFAERFLREAQLACSIRNANVVNVMDVETDNERGISYIVMEYVDGGTVRDTLRAHNRLSEEQALVIVTAVAEALAAAAEFKIVHRDIKPDNIMLTKRGEVKLADLGIAKTTADDVSLTMSNVMMGTPAYLSPEQAKDAKNVDARADIYSLGATLYEMLTGQLPYPGNSAYDILAKLFTDPVPDPRNINPAISAATAKLTMKMLDKNPAHRQADATELLRELDEIEGKRHGSEAQKIIRDALAGVIGETLPTPASTVKHSTISQTLKKKPVIAAAALFAIVAGAGIIWQASRPAPAAPTKAQPEQQQPRQSVKPQTEQPPPKIQAPETPQQQPQPAAAKTEPPAVTPQVQQEVPKPQPVQPVECRWQIAPAGAKVTIHSSSGTLLLETVTPPEGVVNFVLIPGLYQAQISCPGYIAQTQQVIVTEKGLSTGKVTLQEPKGNLVLHTNPGMTLRLYRNEEKIGESVANERGIVILKNITLGEYTAELSGAGYDKLQRNITLQNQGDNRVELKPEKMVAVPASSGQPASITQPTPPARAVAGQGQVKITIRGTPEVVKYANATGGKIRINGGEWLDVKYFPWQQAAPSGTYKVRVKIAGIQSMPNQEVTLSANGSAETYFHAFPEMAELQLVTNAPDAEVCFDNNWVTVKNQITVPALKPCKFQVRAEKYLPKEMEITDLRPGEKRSVQITLDQHGTPGLTEYQNGMKELNAKNYKPAMEFLQKSANQGNPSAAYQLGLIHEKGMGMWFADEKEALKWYTMAAKLNSPDALYKLGLFSENGNGGMKQDNTAAGNYYHEAAKFNHPDALVKMAQKYDTGSDGVGMDEAKAMEYYLRAAQRGHVEAQYQVGYHYENGKGVPSNVPAALEWYGKAAAQGLEKAGQRATVLKEAYKGQ